MDFTSLKPTAAEWVDHTSEANNPAVEWLKESFNATPGDKGAPRMIPGLAPDDARKAARMLVVAGEIANLGVSIRIVVGENEYASSKELWDTLESKNVATVGLKFRAKKRVVRLRKAASPTVTTGNESGDKTPASSPTNRPQTPPAKSNSK